MLTPAQWDQLVERSEHKVLRLRESIRGLGSALVAFSGGVDSTFVLRIARDELGERAVALTAISASVAPEEKREAEALAAELGVRHLSVDSDEVSDPRYAANPTNRCYYCKSELYALCTERAAQLGLAVVVDGFNADDLRDHRPGHQAAREREIRSPLAEVGLTKDEIRAHSRALGLRTWDKPQMPCLASRIPYGTAVTEDRLVQIGSAESDLRAAGLRSFRVRYHGDIARLEVAAEELHRFSDPEFRARINEALRGRGFNYVALDLEPFRSGRLNEAVGLPSAGAHT
ncbi:MAG TPA: ATP-dependent sacrificial sulfur transferase LarE [Myxococcaceae bacterium]